MKILYAIQGTGNGHLARATEIVPLLSSMGETKVLVSGIQGDLSLPFPVHYRLYGLSFIFGEKGGVDLWTTLCRLRPLRFFLDLIRLPVHDYDLVLCDFEPVSAWACRLKGKACTGISHQLAVVHPAAPHPARTNFWGKLILNHYAPVTHRYGFHFSKLDRHHFSPVIRRAIRQTSPSDMGHYTVYLPAYGDSEILSALQAFPEKNWEVFSKHCKKSYRKGNISVRPVSLEAFTVSFTSCRGILCSAGFETPAEALYMGKKLCVIPMSNQYEQACNAAFLSAMGIFVIPRLQGKYRELRNWLDTGPVIRINYPDETILILDTILREGTTKSGKVSAMPGILSQIRTILQRQF
ncbi:MAG: glycosyltransferase family protein [Mangrovibacterium sp.]